MVSLLHQIQQEGLKVLAMDEVQNDAAVRKGGFPHSARRMIHNSYQSVLPSPLNVSSTTVLSAVHPIPAIQSYDAWDKVDGQTELGPELQNQMTLTSATITASIMVDCVAHLGAATLFEALVLKGNAHLTSLTGFITSTYSQLFTVSGDKEEAHRSTMEVVKGVFQECHKFRC
jgi:hypothetical protein